MLQPLEFNTLHGTEFFVKLLKKKKKKIHAFYRTRNFLTVFIEAGHRTLSLAK